MSDLLVWYKCLYFDVDEIQQVRGGGCERSIWFVIVIFFIENSQHILFSGFELDRFLFSFYGSYIFMLILMLQ